MPFKSLMADYRQLLACMNQDKPNPYATVEEVLRALGERLQQLRVRKGLKQTDVAAKANISFRTVRSIELGKGGNLDSFVRLLRALEALPQLDALVPAPQFSPIAALKSPRLPKRVRKPRI